MTCLAQAAFKACMVRRLKTCWGGSPRSRNKAGSPVPPPSLSGRWSRCGRRGRRRPMTPAGLEEGGEAPDNLSCAGGVQNLYGQEPQNLLGRDPSLP